MITTTTTLATTNSYPNAEWTQLLNNSLVHMVIEATIAGDVELVAYLLDSAAKTPAQFNAMVRADFPLYTLAALVPAA